MKESSKLKNIMPFLNISMIVILLLYSYFKNGQITNVNNQLAFITDKVSSEAKLKEQLSQKDSLLNTITNENQKIQQFMLREYELQTLKQAKDFEDFKKLKETLALLNIKVENLNSSVQLSIEKADSSLVLLQPDSTSIDSMNRITLFNFNDTSDNHLKLYGSLNILNKELKYKYNYNATYEVLTHSEERFLGQPKMFATVISNDPNSSVTLKSTLIKQPKAKFHIGIGLGMSVVYSEKVKFLPSINASIFKPILSIY